MVMINPTPGQPDTPNGAPVQGAPNFGGGTVANSIGGAIGGTILGALGIKVNTFNIILNSLFYSGVTAVGLYLFVKGLGYIVSEIPGAPGVGQILTSPIKTAVSKGRELGTKAVSLL